MTYTRRVARVAVPTRGELREETLAISAEERPRPGDGELLVEVAWLSLDPYQRIRLRSLGAGASPPASFVGRVVESRAAEIEEGSLVTGDAVWATHVVLPGSAVRVVETRPGVPEHLHVGLLGLSGLTGYFGIREVARPQSGERVVVTGAFGGVGQVAAQLAALAGADVVGLVGGPDKVAAMEKLGVKAIDHREWDWQAELDAWAPDGVEVLFDNVWSDTSARVAERLKPFGRLTLCGQISHYEQGGGVVGPLPVDDWFRFLSRSLQLRGFRAADYAGDFAVARRELADLYVSGQVTQDTQIVDGLERAPAALRDMVNGRTVGKVVVAVRDGG